MKQWIEIWHAQKKDRKENYMKQWRYKIVVICTSEFMVNVNDLSYMMYNVYV